MVTLKPEPLRRDNFAPFGDVIDVADAAHFTINQGFAERFNDLAQVDVASEGGSTNISIVTAIPRPPMFAPTALKAAAP